MDTANVFEKINKAALKFLSSYSLEKLCDVIVVELISLVDSEHGALYLCREDKLYAIFSSSSGPGRMIRKKSILEKMFRMRKITVIQKKMMQKMQPSLG